MRSARLPCAAIAGTAASTSAAAIPAFSLSVFIMVPLLLRAHPRGPLTSLRSKGAASVRSRVKRSQSAGLPALGGTT